MRRISETVLYVLETWEGQNIFSVNDKKRLILIKKAELNREKKVRTMKICKTCVWTTRACNRKKKVFAKYICGLQYLLLIFARYYKKNLMGNWKWYCFVRRNNLFKFEASIRQKLCYKPEMNGNKPLIWQNYIKILSFWHVTPPMYRQCY